MRLAHVVALVAVIALCDLCVCGTPGRIVDVGAGTQQNRTILKRWQALRPCTFFQLQARDTVAKPVDDDRAQDACEAVTALARAAHWHRYVYDTRFEPTPTETRVPTFCLRWVMLAVCGSTRFTSHAESKGPSHHNQTVPLASFWEAEEGRDDKWSRVQSAFLSGHPWAGPLEDVDPTDANNGVNGAGSLRSSQKFECSVKTLVDLAKAVARSSNMDAHGSKAPKVPSRLKPLTKTIATTFTTTSSSGRDRDRHAGPTWLLPASIIPSKLVQKPTLTAIGCDEDDSDLGKGEVPCGWHWDGPTRVRHDQGLSIAINITGAVRARLDDRPNYHGLVDVSAVRSCDINVRAMPHTDKRGHMDTDDDADDESHDTDNSGRPGKFSISLDVNVIRLGDDVGVCEIPVAVFAPMIRSSVPFVMAFLVCIWFVDRLMRRSRRDAETPEQLEFLLLRRFGERVPRSDTTSTRGRQGRGRGAEPYSSPKRVRWASPVFAHRSLSRSGFRSLTPTRDAPK